MSDVNCPYCGTDQAINHDDGYGYEEGELFSQKCVSCGKTFAFTTSILFSFDATKAPCLNDGEHEWLEETCYPPRVGRKRCVNCGELVRGELAPPPQKRCSDCKRIIEKGSEAHVGRVVCGSCGSMYGH